jgi:hypothetical protein
MIKNLMPFDLYQKSPVKTVFLFEVLLETHVREIEND